MPKIKLPRKERPIGLYLFCNRHKKFYRDDTKVKCKCDDLVYKAKVHVPGTKRMCKTKNIDTQDFELALTKFREFKRELIANSFQKINLNTNEETPIFLTDCMEVFMAYIRNEGIPFHSQKIRNKTVVRGYQRSLEFLGYSLQENNVDPTILKFIDLNELMVGFFCDYLLTKRKMRNKTFNNNVSSIQKFIKFIIRKYDLKCKDYFCDIQKKKVFPIVKSISIEEFWDLLKIVNLENGWYTDKDGKRLSRYRPWIANAFKLGLLTGGRREEVVKLKWNGIKLNRKGEMSHIEINHFKLNRANSQRVSEDEYAVKRIAMNPDLEDLLIELGYHENKDSDAYILASDETATRERMMGLITLAFSHYFKQLNTGQTKSFKHLRKTYITALYIEKGDEAYKDTQHEGPEIMIKHYVDQDSVMDAKQNELRKLGRISKKE